MRVNLATNYTFLNGDLSDWSAENGATRAYTTDYAFYGEGSLLVSKGATNASGVVMNRPIPVQAGKPYAVSMYARLPLAIPASDPAALSLTVTWSNSAGTVVGTSTSGSLVMDDDSQWYRISGVWNAPAGATVISSIRIFQAIAGREGQQFILDALLVEQAAYVGGFFFTHSQAEKYRLAQKALSRVPQVINGLRLGADVSLNNLTFNTIDEFGTIWVIEDIKGWDGQTSPEMPDIGRGTDDGSYDVEGRLTSRGITLSGFFIPANPDQALTDAKDRFVEAIHLVRKGGWLRAHSEPTRAAWVRLSGAPSIVTQNDRGRTQFAISLRAPDPIKYHWDDSDAEGYTRATVRSADIPDELYTNLFTNPSFEAAGTPVEVWRNYAVNPGFETAGASTQVRRNWNTNPRMTSSTTGWTTTGAVATLTATAAGTQIDVTSGPTSSPMIYQNSDFAATTGDVWSASMEVSVPTGYTAVSLQLAVYAYGSNTVIGTSGTVTVQPGTTVTIAANSSSAVQATDTGVRTILYAVGLTSGQRFVVRNALAEKAPTAGKYFDGSNQPHVRRNEATAPRPTSTAGWSSNNGSLYTRSFDATGGRLAGTGAAKFVRSATSPSDMIGSAYSGGTSDWTQAARVKTAPGEVWTVSAWSKADKDFSTFIDVRFYDAAGATISIAFPSATVNGAANTWVRVSVTMTAPANAVTFGIINHSINLQTGTTVGGEQAWMTDALYERGSVLNDFFDGSTTSPAGFASTWEGTAGTSASYMYDTDFTVAWTGTVDASASTLSGLSVSGVNASNAAVIQSTRWKKNGSYSMRLIPLSATASGAATISGMPLSATQMVTSYIEAPLLGTIDGHAMSLRRTTPVQQDKRPNTAGEYSHRLVSTSTSGTSLEMWGGRYGGGDIWYDALTVTSGVYNGPGFNGNASPDTDLVASWTGTVNNSASILTGTQPAVVGANSGSTILRSAQWASKGTYSLRIIPRYPTRGSAYADLASQANPRGMEPGKVYTVIATFRQEAPQGFSGGGLARSIAVVGTSGGYNTSVTANDVAGVQDLRLTFTVPPSGDWYLRLYNAGMEGDPSIWWDNLAIVEGTFTAPAFDGSNADVPGTSYDWTGEPNASTSTKSLWYTDYLNNIGNANVSGLFTITGPVGPGTRIFNALTDETIELAEPLRGKATVGTVIKMAAYNGVATLTTSRYSGLRVGDKVSLLGLPVPFTTPGQVYEVTAASDVFPYSFSFNVATDNIDEVNVSGQVALAENDVLVIDTYEKSVTYNGEVTGHRYRLVTLTDWVRFGPGKNPIEFFDDALQIKVTDKQMSGTTATLTTEDIHYLRAGDRVLVALPETADLSKKSLNANVVTITTATPHGFAAGDTVDVVSVETSTIAFKARTSNTVTLTTVEEHGISVGDFVTVVLPVTATPSSKQLTTNVATITTQNAHGFSIGDSVVVALPATATVTSKQLLSNVATLTTAGSHGYAPGDSITVTMPTDSAVVKKERIGSLAYITTASSHGFSVGDTVIMALPDTAAVANISFNAANNLATVNTSAVHNFSVGDKITMSVTVNSVMAPTFRSATTTTATLTIDSGHGWIVGDRISVTGIDARFNGTYFVTAVTGTTVSYASAGAAVGSTATTGATVTNLTYSTTYNGSKVIETIPSTTSFTFRDWDQTVTVAQRTFTGVVTNNTNISLNGAKTLQSASGVTFTYNL